MLADRLPAMCGNDTLTTLVSSTSMKVASITEIAMIHGFICRCSSAIGVSKILQGRGLRAQGRELSALCPLLFALSVISYKQWAPRRARGAAPARDPVWD